MEDRKFLKIDSLNLTIGELSFVSQVILKALGLEGALFMFYAFMLTQ